MRLEYAKFHNVGPFPDFTLDLTGLGDARLVAICGPNGAGKTFALESAILGSCFRSMPTQGTLVGRATSRDSWLETRLVNGHSYTITHYLDAISRKGEATVFVDGEEAYRGTSVKVFDKWAAKHLPAENVIRSTVFAVQGSGGFLELGSADRISVILRACGVERIERMAKAARAHAGEALAARDALVQRIGDARAGAVEVSIAETALEQTRQNAAATEVLLVAAREAIVRAEFQDRELAERRRVADEASKNRRRIEAALEAARAEVTDLQTRIANNRKVLAEGDVVRAAVADVERLTVELANTRAAADRADADQRRESEKARDLDGQLRDANVRIERAEEALASRSAVEDAEKAIPGLEIAVSEAAGAVGVAEDALSDLQGQRVAGAEDRIKGLRGGLQGVIDRALESGSTVTGVMGAAEDAIETDDQAVALATELPDQLRQAEGAVRIARAAKDAAEKKLADARTKSARRAALDAAEHDQAAAKAKRAEVEKAREAAAAAEHVADEARREHAGRVSKLADALAAAQPIANKAGPLAGAAGRLAELEPTLVTASGRVTTLEAEFASSPVPEDVPHGPALAPLDRAARDAETASRAASAAVVRAEGVLEQARAAGERVASLEAERATTEAELADWNRLALDLGRDGIQSAEVDSAGPELTELANDLLRCFGSRYTVSIETQRLGADGKSMIEECRVQVLDTEAGHEGEAREFSGGQKVILSEAVSLALTMLSCRRAGITRPTLVRDESAAALDPVNARAWIAMLRRAVDLVGADRLLFVSHSREVVEMADAKIEVG